MQSVGVVSNGRLQDLPECFTFKKYTFHYFWKYISTGYSTNFRKKKFYFLRRAYIQAFLKCKSKLYKEIYIEKM